MSASVSACVFPTMPTCEGNFGGGGAIQPPSLPIGAFLAHEVGQLPWLCGQCMILRGAKVQWQTFGVLRRRATSVWQRNRFSVAIGAVSKATRKNPPAGTSRTQ